MRILAAWLLSAALGAAFIAFTSIGPVVYSMGWRHGVHATDVVVLAVLAGWCSWLTWRSWTSGRRSGAAEAGDD